MKLFLAFLGGFGLTLVSFGGGIALAVVYFAAEPVHQPGPSLDTADAWPSEPVRVRRNDDLERLPDRPVSPQAPKQIEVAAESGTSAGETAGEESPIEVDGMTTASLTPDEAPGDEHRVTIMDAHVEWCLDRYRSYRPADNSYQPYGAAGRAPCVSPFFSDDGGTDDFSGEYAADEYPAENEPVFISETVDGGPVMTRDHIQACFDRYRSYRPEDNSYQPYGGGPRRQCE